MAEEKNVSRWSIDKHINLTLVLGFFVQTVAIIWWTSWWASNLDTRVKLLEDRVATVVGTATSIAVMENKISNIDRTLLEIKDVVKEQSRKLEKIDESTK